MHAINLFSTTMMAVYAVTGVSAIAGESLFDSRPLDDSELAEARGGFALPNGMNIDFGVIVTTVVDGARILETQLRVVGDTITTSVLQAVGTQSVTTPGGSLTVAIGNGQSAGAATAGGNDGSSPAVAGSPASVATALTDVGAAVAGSVTGSSAATGAGGSGLVSATPDGGVQINLGSLEVATTANTTPTITVNQSDAGAALAAAVPGGGSDPGSYTLTTKTSSVNEASSITATAILPQLMIQHEVGRSISSLIINTGDGRVIDNSMTLDLSIGNAQPYSIGSVGFRVQSLGVDAAAWRGSGG